MEKSYLLKFDRLLNARDLGGMRTIDGGRIKKGKLIRSEHLTDISECDKTALSATVDTVIDLRTHGEKAQKPDAVIDGISYLHIPILEAFTPGITREQTSEDFIDSILNSGQEGAKNHMCAMYRSFALDDIAVSRYGGFVRSLLTENEKAILWHCTAGKDRAGIAALIIEELLGVPREDIVYDYMLTNVYLNDTIDHLIKSVKASKGDEFKNADRLLRYLFAADKDYIDSFYDALENRFGSFESFAENGLSLSEHDIKRLKELYLE